MIAGPLHVGGGALIMRGVECCACGAVATGDLVLMPTGVDELLTMFDNTDAGDWPSAKLCDACRRVVDESGLYGELLSLPRADLVRLTEAIVSAAARAVVRSRWPLPGDDRGPPPPPESVHRLPSQE